MKKRIVARWLIFLVVLFSIIATTVGLSVSIFTLANFSDSVKKLIFYIETSDAEMTKRQLIRLNYFYELSRRWKVDWLADKYLFEDGPFYKAADSYLIDDWDAVISSLKDKLDDARSYPYSDALYRRAQYRLYKAGKKKEAVDLILKEVSVDFEKALRVCLDSGASYNQCYDRVWNYDLATNKKDLEEALRSPVPQVKYILGPPKEEAGPIPPKGKGGDRKPGDGKEGTEKSGQEGSKKRP